MSLINFKVVMHFIPGNSGTYYPGNNNNQNVPGGNFGGNGYNPASGTAVAFSVVRANTYSNSVSSALRFEHTLTDVGYGWNPRESYFE